MSWTRRSLDEQELEEQVPEEEEPEEVHIEDDHWEQRMKITRRVLTACRPPQPPD